MILKALTLENFKGIREPVRIELAPLTLLFGPNNAGKSTVVQALIYAREVFERNNTDAGRTQLGGDVIDLGGFKNLVHDQDYLNRVIRMRFELDLSQTGLPDYSAWLGNQESENKFKSFLEDRLEMDLDAINQVKTYLTKYWTLWVEVEIAWSKALNHPYIKNYSAGKDQTPYATISVSETNVANTDRACLSFFDFGTEPFVSGDSPLKIELARLARLLVTEILRQVGSKTHGLSKGATVAELGVKVRPGENKVSRRVFDEFVQKIVDGKDVWGDDSIDKETGRQNAYYLKRQELVKCAEDSLRAESLQSFATSLNFEQRTSLLGNLVLPPWDEGNEADKTTLATLTEAADIPPVSPSIAVGKVSDVLRPAGFENVEEESETESLSETDEQPNGWMRKLFDALVAEGYIPQSKDGNSKIALTLRGTALPEWGQRLEPFTNIWLSSDDESAPTTAIAQEYLLDLLSSLIAGPGERLLESLNESIYLGPFRKMPSRHYTPARNQDVGNWASGAAAWDVLMIDGKDLIDKVNRWLADQFNAGYRIEVERYKKLDMDGEIWRQLFSEDIADRQESIRQQLEKLSTESGKLEIINLSSGLALAPQDLGVGISQILPVLVAALHNTQGVVAIEEPESNIHPAFQVVLGDLFISQSMANSGMMFLVETHSEHLILRIMRRMRETYLGKQTGSLRVSPADVSILFVERVGERTIARPMPLNELGELVKAWPGGFFEEGLREQFGDD